MKGSMSIFFSVKTWVRHGCFLALSLFNNCVDCVLGSQGGVFGVIDLVFADDVVLIAVIGGHGDSSPGTAGKGGTLGTSSLLGRDQATGVWRLTIQKLFMHVTKILIPSKLNIPG